MGTITGRVGSRAGRAAGLLLVPLVLAACTSTVTGTGSPAEPPGPPAGATATAEPGPQVVPPPPVGPGTQVEAIRMAGATSLVTAASPDRTASCFPSGPFVDAATLEAQAFAPGTALPTLEAYGFVAAWAECGQDDAGRATLAITMEVSDPGSASAAVIALADAGRSPGDEALVLPTSRAVAVAAQDGDETVQAWSAAGRVVAYVFHTAAPGTARDQADALMADQLALLAAFTPTPQDQVPALPTDPDGLRDLAVDTPGDPDPQTGPYGLDSYTRIAIDPVGERALLEANGFTGFYTKQSSDGVLSYAVALYAFPTSAQTNAVYSEFARLETAAYGGTPITAPSIPDAPCFGFDAGTPELPFLLQRCYVGFGSYLASVDVAGVPALDDTTAMDPLLVAQRDLIDG
ncbi:MAG: hypothetical protein NTW05_07915 [Pseudonocardiales bacterium]|nr:hypothetical protein [Pseudonocardiales bacterium]